MGLQLSEVIQMGSKLRERDAREGRPAEDTGRQWRLQA